MRDDEFIPFDIGTGGESASLDRREFLKLMGGGIFICFSVGESAPYRQPI